MPLKAQNDYIFQKFGGVRPLCPPLATPMSLPIHHMKG